MSAHREGSEVVTTIRSVEPVKDHDLGFDLPKAASVSKGRFLAIGVAALAVLGAALAFGYLPRREQSAELIAASASSQHALPRVEVVAPKLGASDRALLLPGSVQPLQETVLYARASGYLRKWFVDIGDSVTEGQVLAELDTPELDQELAQGQAQLVQGQASLTLARANENLAQANLSRYKQLAPSGVVSKAELDQNQAQASVSNANVDVASANIAAQQANIRRLTQLKAFAKVTAPFAGKITQRTAEIGALVTAGNGQPLFKLAAMDPARVFVQVPQDVAPGVRADVAGTVMVREYPARKFSGVVARSAGELDPSTRTMNTEIRVPNADGALLPGMYAQVALTLPASHTVFELPSTVLMNDATGARVAVVDADDKVRMAPVVVERDNGPTVEISQGLKGNERVAKIGSGAFVEGMSVEVMAPAKDAK